MADQRGSGSEGQSSGQGQGGLPRQVRSSTGAAAGASESTQQRSSSHGGGVDPQNASLPRFVNPKRLQRAPVGVVNQAPSATPAQQPVSSFQPQQAPSLSLAAPNRAPTVPPTAPQARQPVRLFPQPPIPAMNPVAPASTARNHALMQKWINVSNPEVQKAATATSSPTPRPNVRSEDPSTPEQQQRQQQAGPASFRAAPPTTGKHGPARVRPVERATQARLDQLSGGETEDTAELQPQDQPEPPVIRPHSGFVEPASNLPPRRQSMRWTTENDKLLLLFGLGKVPGSWYQAIANFFPEKPTAKAVQERLTKLRAQQRKALTEAGIKDCFETTHGEEMEALSQPPPAKRQRLGSAPGDSVASDAAAPSSGAQQMSSPPPFVPAAALPEESVVVVVEEDVEGEGEEDFEERQRMLEAKKYQEDLERGFFRRGMREG